MKPGRPSVVWEFGADVLLLGIWLPDPELVEYITSVYDEYKRKW
jgi:hypothetical protein